MKYPTNGYCPLCSCHVSGPRVWTRHIQGARHKEQVYFVQRPLGVGEWALDAADEIDYYHDDDDDFDDNLPGMEPLTAPRQGTSNTFPATIPWAYTLNAIINQEPRLTGQAPFHRDFQSRPPRRRVGQPVLLPKHVADVYFANMTTCDCSVCFSALTKDTGKLTPCGHQYCEACLDQLGKCAVCRVPFSYE